MTRLRGDGLISIGRMGPSVDAVSPQRGGEPDRMRVGVRPLVRPAGTSGPALLEDVERLLSGTGVSVGTLTGSEKIEALPLRAACTLAAVAQRAASSEKVADIRLVERLWWCMAAWAKEPIHMPYPDRLGATLLKSLGEPVMGRELVDVEVVREYSGALSAGVRVVRCLLEGRVPPKELLLGAFPRKEHPLAGLKANLFHDCVLSDIAAVDHHLLAGCAQVYGRVLGCGITDDQICAALVYAYATRHVFPFTAALAGAVAAVMCPARAKSLSNILKALGANSTRGGRLLCELNTMVGRGVERVDLLADVTRRIGPTHSCPVVTAPEGDLRRAVRAILEEELGESPVLQEPAEFWASRFRWCVGGSHNVAANASWMDPSQLSCHGLGSQWNRRAALQVASSSPILGWDGRVDITVSEKLEHGKGRVIYSCDTRSYVAFSWLLEPVERAWRSRRVILNPGDGGNVGMYNRICGLAGAGRGATYVMLDYADFNSQHSLESQKIVIQEILGRCLGVDAELGAALVSSFDNMYVRLGGHVIGRVGASLMSGHRATSLINSVLNAAYCRLAWGVGLYEKVRSLHVGDDVLVLASDVEEGWGLIRAMERLGCTLQPAKQSVGTGGFEFLRMAGVVGAAGVGGYLARSIASLASGNWTTTYRLEPREGLHSMVQQARSLINRSFNNDAWRPLVTSVSRLTLIPVCYIGEFLSGDVAVMPGPCFRNDRRYVGRHVTWPTEREVLPPHLSALLRTLPSHASEDYLSCGASQLERLGVALVGGPPRQAMALTCFKAMEPFASCLRLTKHVTPTVSPLSIRLKQGYSQTSEFTTSEQRHGILRQYPLLALLERHFSHEDTVTLLMAAGVTITSNPELQAWGGTVEGTTVRGLFPYADAAGLSSRVLATAIDASPPVAM